jgi:hypothetical protein
VQLAPRCAPSLAGVTAAAALATAAAAAALATAAGDVQAAQQCTCGLQE